MESSALLRINSLITLGLLTASCAGIHNGGGSAIQTLPSDAQAVASGTFSSAYTGITSGGTAAAYYSASEGQEILQIGGMTLPNEAGMEIFANGNIFIASLQYTSGTQNYYFAPSLVSSWTQVSIHSAAKNTNYLIAPMIGQ